MFMTSTTCHGAILHKKTSNYPYYPQATSNHIAPIEAPNQ